MSAPSLQECTHSHTVGIANALRIGLGSPEKWPSTAEEYAVLALRLQREKALRALFRPVDHSKSTVSYSLQLIQFARNIIRGLNSSVEEVSD